MAEVKLPSSSLLKDNSDKAARKELKEASGRTQITKSKGVMSEKTWVEKLAGKFFEGTIGDVTYYLINDLAVPQIKKGVLSAIEIIFFGGASGRNYSSGGNPSSSVPYNSYYIGKNQTMVSNTSRPSPNSAVNELKRDCNPNNLTLADRGDAEGVLLELQRTIDECDQVSVGALFELVGLDTDWTSQNYGWSKKRGGLGNAKVKRTADGSVNTKNKRVLRLKIVKVHKKTTLAL